MSVDPQKLRQAIDNLIANAVVCRCAAAGPYRAARERGVQGSIFAIEIADTGPGIPEPERATIFDRYKQGAWDARPAVRASGWPSHAASRKGTAA